MIRRVLIRVALLGVLTGCAGGGGGSTRDASPGARAEFTTHHGNGFAHHDGARGQPPSYNSGGCDDDGETLLGSILSGLIQGLVSALCGGSDSDGSCDDYF